MLASCGPGPRSHSLVGYRAGSCSAVPTCVGGPGVWEAPVFTERTSVGLDVHARSVVAAAIDGVTGEVFRARLTPGNEEVIDWVRALPGPSAAVYEAGPTGFGLSRAGPPVGLPRSLRSQPRSATSGSCPPAGWDPRTWPSTWPSPRSRPSVA